YDCPDLTAVCCFVETTKGFCDFFLESLICLSVTVNPSQRKSRRQTLFIWFRQINFPSQSTGCSWLPLCILPINGGLSISFRRRCHANSLGNVTSCAKTHIRLN